MQLTLSNVLTIFGFLITIVTIITTNAKTQAVMNERVRHLQEEMSEMKEDIKEHNGYAKRMPAMEVEIKNINQRLDRMEMAKCWSVT